ncbi:MAG: glk [Phenylobacterium sp.]|nr:glk [Phenylobacterium sp.]
MKPQFVGLVGDVGGTNARFALVDGEGRVRHLHIYPARDYGSLAEIVADYLKRTVGGRRPPRAVIAVAGPVLDGEITFTNLDWTVSEGDILAAFEFEAVKLLNDFAAQALACPRLERENLRVIGPPLRGGGPDCPLVVLGAGTGFGVAGLARGPLGDLAIATEGGHAGFAPTDEVEVEVWRRMHAKHGRVSIERLLSGSGLFELYGILCEIGQSAGTCGDEMAVMEAAAAGDRQAALALDRFCAILGSVAGDLALSFGARGGVFVSGGIAPRMAERLAAGPFRERFEAKGRLREFVAEIPTALVLHPYPALLGAARELEQMERL